MRRRGKPGPRPAKAHMTTREPPRAHSGLVNVALLRWQDNTLDAEMRDRRQSALFFLRNLRLGVIQPSEGISVCPWRQNIPMSSFVNLILSWSTHHMLVFCCLAF